MKKDDLKRLLRDVVGDDVDGSDCDAGETIGRFTAVTEPPEPAASEGSGSPQAPDAAPADTTRYEVLQEIGRGGSGVVYRARQTRLMRDIALKKARKSQIDRPHARPAFISEALITGVLDHPNVVPIYDLVDTEDGESAIAMKRVCGTSWKELLHPQTPELLERSRQLDRERHIEILIAVGNAAAYAHSKGIIHRDLKPANVMIGDFGEVMVTDWGMAVVFDHTAATEELERQALTRSREAVTHPSGSPGYMAPEMALGKGDRLGPWTDVYLLGSILHEIITGRRPHEGPSLYEVVKAAFQSAPPEFEDSVPTELQEICRKAMSRRIKSRYQSVEEFQKALRDYLEHRESWKIAATADEARAHFEARWEGRASRSGRRIKDPRDYADLAEALAGYRHALVLWRGNEIARKKERSTCLLYARTAYQAEDFGLTLSLVEGLDDPPRRRPRRRRPHEDGDAGCAPS